MTDIDKWKDAAAPVVDLEKLSDEAGAELLKDNGVWGTDKELHKAVGEFGGHALALSLLASYLKDLHQGDVRQRDRIGPLLDDADAPLHGHAQRVMESYEEEWLSEHPVSHAIMYMIGLFDRPASGGCLDALRAPPAIKGLTDGLVVLEPTRWKRAVARLREALAIKGPTNVLVGLDPSRWKRAITRLRDAQLLAPVDPKDPESLDTHPLIREWFGDRLKEQNETAWGAAHGRLYDHLRDTTREGDTPSLEDLAPLYQAIAHGCRAGRHQEALDDIYTNRICRRLPDGEIEFYSRHKLGAMGSNLAAISGFFDKPYYMPVATLSDADQSWVLGEAASALRAQGRLAEALPAFRMGLGREEEAENYKNAAIAASNLSEAELLTGDIAAAIASAVRSVELADQSSDDFIMLLNRTTHAHALQAAGRGREAEELFAEAERRQKEWQPRQPILYSVRGYQYCDLLISQSDWTAARDRAMQTIVIARDNDWILDIALDTLTLGRAHLGLALESFAAKDKSSAGREDALTARARLDDAVEGLRDAGQIDEFPRSLLARAALWRAVGDWTGAERDLDEVEEIAGPGPMQLYLCDRALERARMALARIEAFAPLNRVLAGSPSKPVAPAAAAADDLMVEARKRLDEASGIITECGYHKRDEELAELDAVLEGARRFADLPPRV